MTPLGKPRISDKANQFTESVIREMTRVALQYGAVNLAQGFPDFPCPLELKQAAIAAITEDIRDFQRIKYTTYKNDNHSGGEGRGCQRQPLPSLFVVNSMMIRFLNVHRCQWN
ncbi:MULTISPECIES: hypothetical protein [Calothrix]|uniref:hypothetical protein n=1 Tax=Calothrix TaxID=1186 RepID=UPI001F54BBE8|nr:MULTISPECIES: hypothetical protein [Calothrix]